jgi:hypothetical protein
MTSNETYIHQQQARNRQIQKPKKQIKIHVNDVFLDFQKPNQAFTQSLVPLVSPLATSISNFCAICCNSNAEKFLTCRTEAKLSTKNLLTVSQTCAYNPSPAKSQQDHHHPHQVDCTNFQTWKLKRSITTIGDSGRTHKKKERKTHRETDPYQRRLNPQQSKSNVY